MPERRELIPTLREPERSDLQKPFEPKLSPAALEPYRNYRGGAIAEEGGIRLMDYWRAIRKRLWLVIGIAVLITTLSAIYMSRRPDIYEAKAQVQVDLEQVNPELVSNERRAPLVNTDPAYFNTQLQILNSPRLLRRVVKEASLDANKEFLAARADESRSTFRSILRVLGLASGEKKKDDEIVSVATGAATTMSGEDLAEAKRLQPFVEELQKRLTSDPVREGRQAIKDTRLINIVYQHTNPDIAALVVNTVAEVFTKQNAERRNKTSNKTNQYLQERVAQLQSEVKADEQQLARLQKNAGIINLDKDKTLALEQLEGLNQQRLKAQSDRQNAEAAYNAATQPGALDALAMDAATRKVYDETRLDIDRLQQRREELIGEYTDEAPEIKDIDRQIASRQKALEENARRNQNNLLSNLKTALEKARNHEANINAEFQRQYQLAEGQKDAGINIKLLSQNIETKRGLLDNLNKQERDNDITAAGTDNNISVVDPAISPERPVAPQRLMAVLMALVLSLAFGCGLALFLEYLDDTVRTTDDVENIIRLPALAVIPTIDSLPRRKLLLAGAGAGDDAVDRQRSELLVSTDSRSALAEAYRQLRTSILLSTAGHAPKSLLITSSVPSEGKTTTAVNTAISLAQTGAKVLIIDADMRRPRLHSIFQISNEHGLSSILSNEMDETEMLNLIQQDDQTNLYLLPSGAVPPNPAELIGSEQMSRLLEIMESNFTHVVVDSPPIASFTDGVLISTMVDGVLLVVHSGKSSRNIVKRARQLLQDVGAKMFGVVLNNVNARSQDNHYYHQNYYSSYYSNSDV